MFKKLLDEIRKACKEGAKEAYAAGYEDATQRCHELYNWGVLYGISLAEVGVEEIEIEDLEEFG